MSNATKPSREPFQAELYVERTKLTQDFLEWIDNLKPSPRLLSVVGAAGSGKSWFMSNLFLHLRQKENILPLWLDLSLQPLRPDGYSSIQVSEEQGRLDWLEEIIQQIALLKDKIPFDRTATFAANFHHFTRLICRSQPRVVLLVDSFDEVPLEETPYWEESVFSLFLSGACTCLIIARRDAYALAHPILRWNDIVIELPGLEPFERQEQVKARLHKEPGRQVPDLSPYLTGNPFVNAVLLRRLENKSHLSSDDLNACIEEVMLRVNAPEPRVVWDLVSKLPPTWTARQMVDRTEMRIDDPRLATLFQAGVVSHISGTAMYKVDAGIYQLIQQSLQAQKNQ